MMPNELGKFLKQQRGKISLREYAKQIGISHAYLNILERGFDPNTGKEANVSSGVLEKISKKCNISINALYDMISGTPYEEAIKTDKIQNEINNAYLEDKKNMNTILPDVEHFLLKQAQEKDENLSQKEILFNKTKDILSDSDWATIEFIMNKTIDEYEKNKRGK